MNKKRSIIESNLEDQDEGEKNQQTIRTSSKKHKQGKYSGNVEDQQLAPEEGVAKVSGFLNYSIFLIIYI